MRKFFVLFSLLFPIGTLAQTPVQVSPVPRQQFFNVTTGAPLVSGCLFTYITQTSTPLATYTDSTGVAQNTNPVILGVDGGANLWLSNSSYRFTLYSSGGVNCASGSFQYTIDGVSAYSILNQAQNLFLLGASSDPAGSAGELAYRTDIPCIRAFTTFWDCLVTLTGTQSLTNKTLASPVFTGTETGIVATSPTLNTPNINGTVVTGPPATYLVMANDLATGTTLNKLAKINPAGLAGFAILPLITDTGGVTGIVVAGAGNTLSATIQQSGSVSCVFDNATTAGNYIQISPTVAGDCHDAGVGYPSSGQVIGRSLATNAGIGTNIIDLFGPEIRAANISDYDNYTPIAYAVAAPGPNHSVSIPAGAVQNSAVIGSIIEVETSFHDGAHTGAAPTYVLSLNASTILTLTLVDATDYDVKATIVLSSGSLARIEVVAMASTPSLAGMTRTVFGSLIDGSAPTIIADSFATATTITGTVDYMHIRVRK